MNFDTAYIISWFGDDEKKPKRKEYHTNQVEWMLEKGLNLVILAQEYSEEDYVQDSRVRYINGPTDRILTPGQARNVLLQDFYESDKDFAIFADNDSILYDHGDGRGFVKHINDNWSRYNLIDMAIPVNPANEPFNKKFSEKKDLFDNNHVFTRTSNCKGSLFFLRNLKKHYNKEIYNAGIYDVNEDGGIIGGEDGDLALQFIANGLGVYKFENLILKEFGGASNSTWSENMEHRVSLADLMHITWHDRFKDCGMELKDGRVNRKTFMKRNFKHPAKVIISYSTTLDNLMV